jgi:phosphotransferase system  glucose/maltose/N-acetylglucosamine-specific IIC component
MVLCYVVTTSMVGFAFGMVGLALGWNTRNQMPLLKLITIPVLLVTTYVCFRFLVKELAAKAVDRALEERQKQQAEEKKASSSQIAADRPARSAPVHLGESDVA